MSKISKRLLFIILISICSSSNIAKSNNITIVNPTKCQELNDSIEKKDNHLISSFPNLVLGKEVNSYKKLLPENIANKFFPYLLNSEDGDSGKLYAIGKILNHKGFDLFVCDCEYNRPDEDSYDNHTDNIRYLFLFKNGYPFQRSQYGEIEQVIYTLNSHYYGEGGESEYYSYFDNDTTLVTYQHISESESATGYITPINSTKKFRSKLTEKGEMEVIEFNQIEFSSPFYNQIQEPYYQSYPTKGHKWQLNLNGGFFKSPDLFNESLNLYFYIQNQDGQSVAVFESYKDDELIDCYIIGQEKNITSQEKDYTQRTKILKCPIIIKTSDGDLELLPNGQFRLNTQQR